jgi:Protein of unknown function (DUF2510)
LSVEGTPNPSIPAGWYPDPAAPGGKRWWDGARWTHDVQAEPEPPLVVPSRAPIARGESLSTGSSAHYSKITPVTGVVHTRVSGWLAASPLWLVLPQVLLVSIISSLGVSITAPVELGTVALSLALYVVLVRLAFADRAGLLAGGNVTAASPWWMLLSPLAYLIARCLQVRMYEQAGAWAPLVWWAVAAILTPGIAVLSFFAAYGIFAA